jgi:hypothetical protein
VTYEEFEASAIKKATKEYGKPVSLERRVYDAIKYWYDKDENMSEAVEAIIDNSYYWDM